MNFQKIWGKTSGWGRVVWCAVALTVFGITAFEIYLRVQLFSFRPAFFEEDIPFIHQEEVRREGIYQWDPWLFWKYRPRASSQINSLGFRDREFSIEKKTKFRIMALGDSCTAGHQLPFEKTYSFYLEKRLNNGQTMGPYEVINAGVPGYSSFQGLRYFRRLVRQYRPDIVLVFYGANDRGMARFSDKELSYRKVIALFIFRWMEENFKTVQFLMEWIESSREALWKIRVVPEDYRRNLETIAGEARARKIRVVFVKPCLRTEIESGREDNDYVPPQPRVDLFELFLKVCGGLPDKIFFDAKHFTELGHQLIAQAICEKLIGQ